jgi:hypothetical protein
VEIRSYRRVFDLERRIYRVDRLRLNPGGVPVRGVLYFAATLTATLIAGRLPLLRSLLGVPPWYLRDLALPAASAAVLTMIRIDGRPFHLAACALLCHWTGARRSIVGARPRAVGRAGRRRRGYAGDARGFAAWRRWGPEEIVILPDGSDGRMRRLRYAGPGAVLVAVEHERVGRAIERRAIGMGRGGRRPALILRELEGRRALSQGQVIALAPGVRLLVRAGAPARRRPRSSSRADLDPPRGSAAGEMAG